MPRESSMVFINYSEYSCVWCFCLVWLNESWWQTSNDGLWDFSLKCLWSLLWMDIFLSTAPFPAISLPPRSSQLWLCVYLLAIAHIILCSSHSSDNCQVHMQLIPEGLSSIHHTLLSFWPYSASLTFMSPTQTAPELPPWQVHLNGNWSWASHWASTQQWVKMCGLQVKKMESE